MASGAPIITVTNYRETRHGLTSEPAVIILLYQVDQILGLGNPEVLFLLFRKVCVGSGNWPLFCKLYPSFLSPLQETFRLFLLNFMFSCLKPHSPHHCLPSCRTGAKPNIHKLLFPSKDKTQAIWIIKEVISE